ncbi:MAG: hypothetical protein ABR607_00665 [Pyrinomonadaceae bacterium]
MAARSSQIRFSNPGFLIGILALSILCASAAVVVRSHQQATSVKVPQAGRLFRIEVEDSDEAGLIQQELKLKPELLQARYFYYYGDDNINRTLASYGYSPVAADPEAVFSRIVRVAPQKDDAPLRKLGAATLLLRERNSWVLRGTVKQLRELERAGYLMKEQANREPVPRRIQITLVPVSLNNQIGGRVEIVGIQRVRGGRAVTVTGEAFDDAIKDLRARGLKVEILPDYPGVVR